MENGGKRYFSITRSATREEEQDVQSRRLVAPVIGDLGGNIGYVSSLVASNIGPVLVSYISPLPQIHKHTAVSGTGQEVGAGKDGIAWVGDICRGP